MVIHGIPAAVSAINVIHVARIQHIVIVVVMAGDYGLDVPHLAELGQQAAVQAGRAGRLSVGAP